MPLFSPPQIPIGGIIDFYGSTLPSGWLWCNGVAIPAQYTAAIAAIGANTPDLRGRTTFGLDAMGGAADAARIITADSVGNTGGSQDILTGHLPNHVHNNTATGSMSAGNLSFAVWSENSGITNWAFDNGSGGPTQRSFNINSAPTVSGTVGVSVTNVNNASGAGSDGTGLGFRLPPHMMVTKIIRVT